MATSIIALRPRTLEHILHDLRHARRDLDDVLAAIADALAREEYDAADDLQDRASEAETRLDDLREEANAAIIRALGMPFEALMTMREECLL